MQIHYCYTCNKRVESDDSVTIDQKIFCRDCASKVPTVDDRPLGRATPSRGLQRRTPGHKTPSNPGPHSPPRGTPSPARSSKTGIRPASPAGGVPTRSIARSSGANAIPARPSTTNITPARQSGGHTSALKRPSSGNPVVSTREHSAPKASAPEPAQSAGEPRRRGNNTLIWVLAAIALLLAGVGAALLVGGNSAPQPRPPSVQTR